MTGLVRDRSCEPSLFDTMDQRYAKQKQSASNFIICQIGLSIFSKDVKSNMYSINLMFNFITYRLLSQYLVTIQRLTRFISVPVL